MTRFQCIRNPESIVEFTDPWDVEGMRIHPDYVEIDDAGKPVREVREDREPWHFVFTPNPPTPKATPKAKRKG